MNIQTLQNEIKGLYYNLPCEIKNKNELYININPLHYKELVQRLLQSYKLLFVAEFCRQEEKSFITSTILSNRKEGYFVVISYPTDSELISLGGLVLQSDLFEREISDMYGIKIVDGNDTRNLVKHESWAADVYPMRKEHTFGGKIELKNEIPPYQFKEVSGDNAYQIPVGPVHAGIIEPGHFRFSVMGEPIENLEIRLMYKHKGIEKLCENVAADKLNLIFERVSGESSVAYAEACAQLLEKLASMSVPDEIRALRVVLLELERIYNFLDDIAGICVDVAYSYPAKKYGYFSEQIHQLCERLTGSRFMRSCIIAGGSNIGFTLENKADILSALNGMKARLEKIINMTVDEVSFLDRVEHTGLVYKDTAKKLYLTGVVGRASGIKYDVRHSFSYELYKDIKKDINVLELGGVFERYLMKIAELKDAFSFIEAALEYIKSDIPISKPAIDLKPGSEAIAAVETVKGELVVYGQAGENNTFNRIYFKTPSFTNWNGLTYAVLGEIVPDFPLCNKSFNMSYSENDR